MSADNPDWTNSILVITGGGMGQDFPDWTDGIVQLTSGQWLTDFPDWTKAEIVAPGGGAGGAGPNPVPGSVFWVDAQSITGLADGAAVTDWADRSGHLRDATSTAEGRPPVYHSTTVANLISGYPAVFFSGDASNQTTLSTGSFTVNMPFTVAAVLQSHGATTMVRSLLADHANEQPFAGMLADATPFFEGDLLDFTFGAALAAGRHSLIYSYNGVSTLCYVDGAPVTPSIVSAPILTNIVTGVQLGGVSNAGGLNCDVGEILLWPFSFNSVQASEQYSYFHIRWGVP